MSRALVEYVVPWLVDNPDDVEISETTGEGDSIVLEISVHADDMGKIIGKQGRIIRSLRTLARAAGQRSGESIMVEVVD
ncbi:MAG: KH domain-containing protein [Actinomycetota bacterium]